VDTARSTDGDLRHAAVLEAVAFAAEHLLLATDWRDAADEVLERMGRAAGVSRAYVIENHLDGKGRLLGTMRHEWCAHGVGSSLMDPSLSAAPWADGFGRWAALHARGEAIVSHIADLPAGERAELEAQGVSSIAQHPIFVGGEWWGALGFDDCEGERRWTSELDALRAAATLIGAAVVRHRAEDERRRAERRWLDVIEHIPAVTYTDIVVAPGDVRMGFVSPQIQTMLGYEPDQFSEDQRLWLSLIEPEDLARLQDSGALESSDVSPFDEVYRMRAADGSYRWIHDTSTPIFRDDGTLDHFLGFAIDVTARMQAQELVRQAEERYRLLVERTPAISYTEEAAEVYDPDSAVSYLSPQVEGLLGYPVQAWEQAGFWTQVCHPDDRDAVAAESKRTSATGEPYRQEYRMLTADGRVVWIHDESVLVRDSRGEPLYWHGVMVDVTERKNTEERLRQAEERFRTLVEHIPAVVYAEPIEPDPELLYLSPRVEHVLGWTPADWQGEEGFWLNLLHPDDRARVEELNMIADATLQPFAAEYRLRHQQGHYVWILDEAVVVLDAEGAPLFWQGVMLDVSQRKDTEHALAEAEARFRTIVEQNQAIFYTQDIDPADPSISLTTYIAPGNTDLIGYTLEDIEADPALWRSIIHPDDRDRVLSADAESNTGETDRFSMEYRMIAKDGRIVWVQDEARMVSLPGKRPYWQGFLLDVTERKQSQAQLERALAVERQASQRLRSLDEMKNTFLQAVSHDLRTPLAAILGLAVTLERRDLQLDEADARDLAHRIAANARRLDRLVANLLDMDRLERGIVSPTVEPVDVGVLVGRIVEESGLVSEDRLETELAPIEQDVDVSKVERIVENLLANAARHAPATSTIWVRVVAAPGGVEIVVEDEGDGVPRELRDVVFEPFRQGPEAPKHSPGVGIGLALVQRFAALQGGRAWVQEREGGGASFHVFLPETFQEAEDP
jgi:PAS domain S-box-containing protein